MYVINKTAQDVNGNAIAGASCFVYARGTTTIVPITDAAGAPKANPFFSATGGLIQFSAEPGEYDLRVLLDQSDSTIPVSVIGSAGLTDSGLNPDDTPQNSDLGSAAYTDSIEYSAFVNSVDDIRSSQIKDKYRYCTTSGYYNNGDGGGAFYYLDEADTTTADDGFLCIVASDGGRWKLNEGPTVKVKQAGAVGDNSADDTAAVSAAVARAKAAGKSLELSAGVYLTTASIKDLHAIKHKGLGQIKRGTDVFSPVIAESGTNTLYVDKNGADTNDGITAAEPFGTLAAALDALTNYGPTLRGQWVIQLAAGSNYDYGITVDDLYSVNAVVIQGPEVAHPTVPLATVGPVSAATSGWVFENTKVKIRNLKFINFDSNASSYGLGVRRDGWLFTENVHVDGCTIGITGNGLCVLNVKGGIIENCNEGIRSLFGCYHSIGNQAATDLTDGPIIRGNVIGFSAREASSGHSDWVTYEDNTFGLEAQVNARVNCSYSDFKRNTVAIRIRGSGNVLRTGVSFNTGTPDANEMNVRNQSFGSDFEFPNSNTPYILERNLDIATVTGTTVETDLKTYTLGADNYSSVIGSTYQGKRIKVIARGSFIGVAGTKTIRVRLDATNTIAIVAPASASGRFEFVGEIFIKGNTEQRNNGILHMTGIQSELTAGNTAVDFASGSDVTMKLSGDLADAGDSINIDLFQIEVDG